MTPIMNTGHLNIYRQPNSQASTQAVSAVQQSHQSATSDRHDLETQRPVQTRRTEPEHTDTASMFQHKYRQPQTTELEQALLHKLAQAPTQAQTDANWKLNAEPAHKASPVVVKSLGHAEAMPATQLNIYV